MCSKIGVRRSRLLVPFSLRSSYDFFEPRISVSDTPIFGGGEVQGVGAQVSEYTLKFSFILLADVLSLFSLSLLPRFLCKFCPAK